MCKLLQGDFIHKAELAKCVVHVDGKKLWRAMTVIGNSGVIIAECAVKTGPQYARLFSLYVHPHLRRQGVARRLMKFACDVVAENLDVYVEIDSFELEQHRDSEPGPTDKDLRKFYLSLGFETVLGHPFSLVLRRKNADT